MEIRNTKYEPAALAGYLICRMSATRLPRGQRHILQIDVWDGDIDRLEWAVEIMNRHLPPGRTKAKLKISWQEHRKQGAIHVTGQRAHSLLQLVEPFVGKHLLRRAGA